jgi:ADP-heptose:LPS heptosyltransferase
MKTFKGVVTYILFWLDAALAYASRILKRCVKDQRVPRPCIIITMLGGVGDYMLLTPVLLEYRRLFPQWRIVMIVRSSNAELATKDPSVDLVIALNYRGFRWNPIEKIRVWTNMIPLDVRVFVNADYSTHHEKHARTLVNWSQAKRSIAFECLDGGQERDYAAYGEIVRQDKEWMFEIDRDYEMVRYLGANCSASYQTRIYGIESYLPPDRDILALAGRKYYVLFPGSSIEGKCWPIDKFCGFVRAVEELHMEVVIAGGKNEQTLGHSITSLLTIGFIDLVGKTSLLDLSFVIKHASFILSNDTSAAHIAQAVGTKAFVILGGGYYGRFLPYPAPSSVVPIVDYNYSECFRCRWNCIYPYWKCIKDNTVERVVSEVLGAMGRS